MLGLARELGAARPPRRQCSLLVGRGRSARHCSTRGLVVSAAPCPSGPTDPSLRSHSGRRRRCERFGPYAKVDFDVVHLHEPLAPGASYASFDAVRSARRSGRSTAAAEVFCIPSFDPLARALADRLDVRCAVSEAARDTAEKALGGSYEIVGNGVEVERFSAAEPWPTEGPTVMFVGRHETRKGLGDPARGVQPSRQSAKRSAGWPVRSGDRTVEDAYPPSRSFGWLGRDRRRRAGQTAPRVRGGVLPFARGRVLRGRAPRSDGRRSRRSWRATCPVTARSQTNVRSFVRSRRRRGRSRPVLRRRFGRDSELGEGRRLSARSRPRLAHAESFSMATMAGRYVSLYERGDPEVRGPPLTSLRAPAAPAVHFGRASSNGPGRPQGARARKRSGPGNSAASASAGAKGSASRPAGGRTATGQQASGRAAARRQTGCRRQAGVWSGPERHRRHQGRHGPAT